jgi:hypothetical protein
MGNLVFQATLGGQVNLVGPNTASTFNLNVPAVAGTLVTTGDTGTVTNTMLASSAYTAPGTIGSGTPNTGAFTTLTTTSTINNLTVGRGAGSVSTNTAVGASALAGSNSGTGNNTAVGYQSLLTNSTGYNLVGLGYQALTLNTTGYSNVAVGGVTLASNTTGNTNAAVGHGSLASNTTGSSNTALGFYSLLSNTTASNNTAVGYQAGYVNTGPNNVFLGYQAGVANTTGEQNTFVGRVAGAAITTGGKNSILGSYNGNQGGLDITTGSNNIVLSDGDGNPMLRIPSNGDIQTISSASNFSLRNSGTAGTTNAFITGLYSASSITAGGTVSLRIWTNGNIQNTNNSYGSLSDIKLKENIVDATPKLEKLCQVRVVNYNFKDGQTHKQIGVIAQELEQVFPSMIDETPDIDADGNDLGTTTKAVKYSVFVPMLIKAIQELKAEFDAYKEAHP